MGKSPKPKGSSKSATSGEQNAINGALSSTVEVTGTPSSVINEISVDLLDLMRCSVTRQIKNEDEKGFVPDFKTTIAGMTLGIANVRKTYKAGISYYTYEFEGLYKEGGYDSKSGAKGKQVWEIDLSLSEAPISAHPKFEEMKSKYGWNPDTREFPYDNPLYSGGGNKSGSSQKSAGTGLLDIGSGLDTGRGLDIVPRSNKDGDDSKNKVSPMYGVESFLVPAATLRCTQICTRLTTDIFKNIGKINDPQIDAEELGIKEVVVYLASGSRNWLKGAPRCSRRGNCYEVTQEWILSGPRGWMKIMYG